MMQTTKVQNLKLEKTIFMSRNPFWRKW